METPQDELFMSQEDLDDGMDAGELIEGENFMPDYTEVHSGIIDYGDEGDMALDLDSDSDTNIDGGNYPDTPHERISRQEQLRMIHLRSYLDQLTEKVKHRKYVADKTREELKKCHERIEHLEVERDQVFGEVQSAQVEENTASLYRLRSHHERVCTELEGEQDLETKIKSTLLQTEYDLNKAETEQGKFLLEEEELERKEELLRIQKVDMAVLRLKKEEKFAYQAQQARKSRERSELEALREGKMKQQKAMEEARNSQEETSAYLKQTIAKIKRREQGREKIYKADMQKKMDMLVKLKGDISRNRENLNALRARDSAREREERQKEEAERQRILEQGGNPDEVLLIRKRLDDFEKEKQQFESKKKDKQVEILNKILVEEERLMKRKIKQPLLWTDPKREKEKFVIPHKKKPLKIFKDADITEPSLTEFEAYLRQQEKEEALPKKPTLLSSERTNQGVTVNIENEDKDDDKSSNGDEEVSEEEFIDVEGGNINMAQPEFEGLWDQHKPYRVPKDMDVTTNVPGASKMDKDIMEKMLEKQKESIVRKQVAAGREFKGRPFYSKPDLIQFKDFDVGKSYKKRVILTNVSYSVNYCKYIGITEHLKDFIDIHFDPPGQMSAGMTCEMLVTFKPMINEDLTGEVSFLAQTGPFSIPLLCTTKKCDLTLDHDVVDFSTTVIGESLKRTYTLTNRGALGTSYDFYKVTGLKQRTVTTAETSLGRLTTADTIRAVSPLSDIPVAALEKPTEAKTVLESKNGEVEVEEEAITGGDAETTEKGSDVKEALTGTVNGGSPDLAVSDLDDYDALDGMKAVGRASGDIGPFSSVKLEVTWQPSIPGRVDCEFAVTFADPLSEGLSMRALGHAIDVPVWVERQSVDLKICMFDRLYQDTIIANNRATTALRLKFEVCKELRNHLELLPKTGYIQAQSHFSAQLKFLPRKSLFEEASKYFDPETGVLEAPMIIRVADQTKPVPFTVQAVLTSSDLEFDLTNIDFGCSTIYESVKQSIKLTNKSILPQQYGFLGLPDFVEVQPNDGFGTLLPLETIKLDVIFSPKKAKGYKFDLICKSLINRDFKVQCKGVGVHPPLELTHQVVRFKATSLYDVSTASLHVLNSHTSMNEFTHPVPRIGKGEIAPVGPTSFEFVVPEGAPIMVSPAVGTVEPGKKCHVQVRFCPTLGREDIQKEGVRMATKSLEAKALREYNDQLQKQREAAEQAKKKQPAAKKGASAKGKAKPAGVPSSGSEAMHLEGPKPITPPDLDSITKGSSAYNSSIGSLLRQTKGQFSTYVIPCYVASGRCGNPGELPYSIHNTLYLEVHCPTVKPPVVVISDNGNTVSEFEDVSVGQHVSQSFTIQNISGKNLELKSSILDTNGPYQMLNAMRILPPDATHTVLLSFTPSAAEISQEVLEIQSATATLYVTLRGRGVDPIIHLSIDKMLDMGAVLVGEYLEKAFKIQNVSTLSVDYAIKLDSLSLLKHARAQGLPAFLNLEKKHKSLVGTQNNNGQNVFDCVPSEGTIPPGATHEIMVTFAPDHSSDFYSDGVRIELFHQEEAYHFQMMGMAKPRIMFVDGVDGRMPEVESLSSDPRLGDEEDEAKPALVPVLFTLYSRAKEIEFTTASRDLFVGCVRTMAVSQKKSGEFTFDNIQPLVVKGFNIDPQKGMVEAGTKKAVTVTWTPPPGHDPNQPMEASIILSLRGDVVEQIKLMIKAFVISD